MARPTVPKFGNWEKEDEPYTAYFDQARKHKGGKIINPNDPQHYPDMFKTSVPSKPRIQTEEPIKRAAVRPHTNINDRHNQVNREGQLSNHGSSRGGHGGGSNSGRPRRNSGGSDHSFDKSPLHPQHRAKVAAAAGGGRGSSSYGVNWKSPSRLKPESPDNAAVPRFGDWDEINPQSAENYTEIFNKVRETRRKDSANVSGTPSRPSYNTQRQEERSQKCCFPWW